MKQKFDRFNYIKMKLNYELQKYTNKSDKVQKIKLPHTLQRKANNPNLPKIFINRKEKKFSRKFSSKHKKASDKIKCINCQYIP